MASVSVVGGNSTNGVVIPTTSAAVSAASQDALAAITAAIVAQSEAAETYLGSGPVTVAGSIPAALTITEPAAVSITANIDVAAILDTATGPVSVTDNDPQAVTILSGLGGLTLNRGATAAGTALVLAGGGTNQINLGGGSTTVGVDGAATVSALNGTDSILAGAGGDALIEAGGSDTLTLAGTDTVAFAAAATTAATVSVQDGADAVFEGQIGVTAPIVSLAPGLDEVIGTLAGSTATVSGSAGGMMLVSAWGGRTFVDPNAANVMVFPGSGTETVFGAGDDSLPGVSLPASVSLSNTGSDFVFAGQGYFHGGSGALNVLIASTVAGAATLVGGGTIDILFSEGANDSLRGAAGTVIMNAAGFSETGFTVSGAPGGDVLDAGGSHAFMFGSAWGSNTIISGSGAATVFGNHGLPSAPAGNVYVDGGAGGSLSILDFVAGLDVVRLQGHTVVSSSVTTGAQSGSTVPGTSVTLSDGTTIVLVDQSLTAAQISAAFK